MSKRFTKVRFTSSVYRPKSNYGTTVCYFKDSSGNIIYTISGGNNSVCPTSGKKEHIISNPFNSAFYVTLTRYIDTRSNGNATIKIELYDSFLDKWYTVASDSHYRTGNGYETKTYSLIYSSYSIGENNIVPLTFTKGNITSKYDLYSSQMTEHYIKLQNINSKKSLYGALVPFSPPNPIFSCLINGKKYYLSNEISQFKYRLTKNYLQPAWQYETGIQNTGLCKMCKIIFNSRGQSYGSHKGNNGTHYGTFEIQVLNKDNQVLELKKITVWNYLGGDSTHNANITNREIFYKVFNEPAKVILKWNLDLGGYKAHIWGSQHYITAVANIDINIECS